jgi:hypothetical protein
MLTASDIVTHLHSRKLQPFCLSVSNWRPSSNSVSEKVPRKDEANGYKVRYIGELHVNEDLGRIPTAQDWLSPIKPERWMVGTSLLLGSWFGVLVGLILLIMLARLAMLEERALREELPGYAAYMARVKYPFIL